MFDSKKVDNPYFCLPEVTCLKKGWSHKKNLKSGRKSELCPSEQFSKKMVILNQCIDFEIAPMPCLKVP